MCIESNVEKPAPTETGKTLAVAVRPTAAAQRGRASHSLQHVAEEDGRTQTFVLIHST